MALRRGRFTIADRFAVATAAVGFLHHVDHVLRFDHSGWPFVPQVNAFTYSLLSIIGTVSHVFKKLRAKRVPEIKTRFPKKSPA